MFTSDWDEKRTGIVTLEDIKSSGFSIVLKFMYSGEGDEAWTSCSEEVIYAADKVRHAKRAGMQKVTKGVILDLL